MSKLRLWSLRWWAGGPVAFGIGLLWLTFIRLAGSGLSSSSYLTSTLLGIVGSTLSAAFLLKLPEGKWWQRLLCELLLAVGVAAGSAGLLLFLRLITPDSLLEQNGGLQAISIVYLRDDLYRSGLAAIGFAMISYSVVRLFGQGYSLWFDLRQKRLLWEITHIQVRLVLVVGLLAMALYLFLARTATGPLGSDLPTRLINALTTLVIVGGFLGLLTGGAMIAILIPASILSFFTARRITRRLERLIEATEAFRAGAYDTRISVEGRDEVAQLQTDFNTMAETLEQALTDLQAERDAVADLLESRRMLFAGISHELRTPVATLRGYLEGLRRQPGTDQQADLAIMEREVLRLQRMIDDVFTLARTDVDQLRIDARPVEPGAVVARTVQAIKWQAWQAKKVDIVLEHEPSLPLIQADETRLEQIMYNLLRNAVRHTPPGGLVSVVVTPEADMVRFNVRDTGGGIADVDLPHIWERFYRADSVRAEDQDGSGLGLALVKELTEAMGGRVGVETVPGDGSCFCVWLPRVSKKLTP